VGAQPSAATIRAVRPLEGELPLRAFERYRSAGRLVRRELDDAERLRLELLRARTAPRRFPYAVAARLLAGWNAYVLPVVGEHLEEAVRLRSFGSVRGEATARILGFLAPVDRWLAQGRRAAADASYRIEEHVFLPAEPPAWPNRTYGPYPLPTAMATALRAIHTRAASTLENLLRAPMREEEDLVWLRWMLDGAMTAIEYTAEPDHEDRAWSRSTAAYLRYALRMLFLFGQTAAMPEVLDTRDVTTVVSLAARGPARIDIWALTDPRQRAAWRSRPRAREAVERMWAADPRPAETARVQAQIDAALRTGAIAFATDGAGERLGCLHRCPWPAVYEVRRPVTVGGLHLLSLDHFTFDALSDGRRIVVSDFVPAEVTGAGRPVGRGGEPPRMRE
jgi:hypothetical protein